MKPNSPILRQQRNIYELKKTHPDKYHHLLGVGFSEHTAEQRLKSEVGRESLTKLKSRIWIAENSFGVTGVSLDGIKETVEVRKYIQELVDTDVVTRSAGSLKLNHPKIYKRY